MKNVQQHSKLSLILASAVASLAQFGAALRGGALQSGDLIPKLPRRTKSVNNYAGAKVANKAYEGKASLGVHGNGKKPIDGIYGPRFKRANQKLRAGVSVRNCGF